MSKYRVQQWIDLRDGLTLYGVQKHHEGRWDHYREDGELLIYPTKHKADEKIRELKDRQQGDRDDG